MLEHIDSFKTKAGHVFLDKTDRRDPYIVTWEYTNEPQEFRAVANVVSATQLFLSICDTLMARGEVV